MDTVSSWATRMIIFFTEKKSIIGFYRNQWIIRMNEVTSQTKCIHSSAQRQTRPHVGPAILETTDKSTSEFLMSVVFITYRKTESTVTYFLSNLIYPVIS